MSNSSNKKILRVGIVDDSALVREIIKKIVDSRADMEVVGEAEDPLEAREMIKRVDPDVITLDIEMPRMNGIEFLEKLMRLRPMPVIMVSTLTQKGAEITVQALEMGALDYVAKPLDQGDAQKLFDVFQDELVRKLKQVRVIEGSLQNRLALQKTKLAKATKTNKQYNLIAIASSTGGIERLRYVVSRLECNMPPIVIVQHINERYVPNMVSRMQEGAPEHISVKIAENLKTLENNTVYFADNLRHVTVRYHQGRYQFVLVDDPPLNGFIASADYLFDSVSKGMPERSLGIIISGMGNDGAQGLLSMYEKGANTLGENKQSCLVYGMSQAAAKLGAVKLETTIQGISRILNNEGVNA